MIEFNIKNKLISNISNSSVKILLLSLSLRNLSISECKVKSIEKGLFNLMFQLNALSLTKNEIQSIEKDSFLFQTLETHLFELYLTENKLNKIKSGAFNGLYRLQILFLDKNQIEEIDINSFETLNDLRQLNIQSNKIKIIKNEIFFERTNLEILFLYNNNIESIESIPFNTLRALKKLHLFSNKLKTIKFGNFIHLQNLKELKLDKNEIGSFDANTFIGLEKLSFLDLSANKIRRLVNGAFHGLINVERFYLHLNDIDQIEMNAFTDLVNLDFLNLDSNQISTLTNVQFNLKLDKLSIRFNMLSNFIEINSNSLKYLWVSNNRFQEIDLITRLPNLEYLDLSQNRLITFKEESFLNLHKLMFLNLSYNKLDLKSEFNNISYFKGQSVLELLDLSYNEIQYLDSNVTFQYLRSLKVLNVSNNKLKSIESYIFGHLNQLNELNLVSNNLSFLNENSFFNLRNLKLLKLSFNQISTLVFLKFNIENLEILDLEQNKINSIEENDFDFNQRLLLINLNSNLIKIIHTKAFERLTLLETLKISNTSINNWFMNSNLSELDFSYLNLTISNIELLSKIKWINLAKSKVNCSFELFLNNATKYIDFSFNELKWENDFKMFRILGSSLETLKLRQTNLQKLEQINIKNLINLKWLDLSFNNLSFISQDSFEFNLNLEYLDLSSNRLYEFSMVLNKLSYLNLENNQINSTSDVLNDYYSIEIFKMEHNKLRKYPSFEMSQISSQNVETFLEFHLNHNQIDEIKYFSFIFGKLILANFQSNNISLIENDAFLNCRSLEYLSIANNRLNNLKENNFHFLFSLIQLNLSFNEINFIEKDTFKNLNKLKSLDLNFNKLLSIYNDLFYGLINLNNLHLLSRYEMTFHYQSFNHLPNISTIVLNESLILKYKCLFMHNLQRDIQRNVANKYIFFKSINLITLNFSLNDNLKSKCDLMFHLFQFKIHFNLKRDHENDLFYNSCQSVLISKENNFNHNKRKCFSNFEFVDKEEENEIPLLHPIFRVLSNIYYLLTMILLLILLCPVFYMICRYELFSNLIAFIFSNSSSNKEKIQKKLELDIQRKRENLNKKLLVFSNYQKATLVLSNLIQKDKIELSNLEGKKRANN